MEPLVQWFRGGPKKEDRPALQLQEVAWNRTTPPTVLEINRTNDDQLSAGQRSLTFVVVSDTHDKHEKLVLPDADVLLHCGDYSNHTDSKGGIERFNRWLGTLPHRHRIVVAGNHENYFKGKSKAEIKRILSNASFLWDEELIVNGCKIYGAPYHIKRNGLLYWAGAFGLDEAEAARAYRSIPADTDILLTHAPPSGIMDINGGNKCMGSAALIEAVRRVSPLVHCFGHNHDHPGMQRLGNTIFMNATSYGGSPTPRPPILFKLYYTPKGETAAV